MATLTTKQVQAARNGKSGKTPSKNAFLDRPELPYTTRLSFVPLLNDWEQRLGSDEIPERLMAEKILAKAKEIPELWQPIDDLSVLDKHEELVSWLLAGLFPLSLRDSQLGKAAKPFDMEPFFVTPAVKKMLADCSMDVTVETSADLSVNTLHLKMCSMILNDCYGQNLDVDPVVIFSMGSKTCGLSRHYKSEMTIQFVEVVPTKPLKKLTQEQIDKLLCNIYDMDAWMKALPPDAFEIHGIVGVNLVDVTKEETLSRLRQHLLKKDALTSRENIEYIQSLLRDYFQLPDLRFGIMAMDYPVNKDRNDNRYGIQHCLIDRWQDCRLADENHQSIYAKAARFGHNVLLENMEWVKAPTQAEKTLMKKGFKSYLVAPLKGKEDRIIGLMEIGAERPFAINSFTELQLHDLMALFHTALERSREETDNRIEAIMREQFTAIHPSVQWRFIDAAFEIMSQQQKGIINPATPDIAFESVYPMYAQADIVNSSITRNHVIQQDFIKNLQLLEEVLSVANEKLDYPLLEQYLLETRQKLTELEQNLDTSDEHLLMDYILLEVHPVLEEVVRQNAILMEAYRNYTGQLDPHLGIVYLHRKAYEQSVNRINNHLSEIVERAQIKAQEIVPHYFEKYKTDGVQFELYAGQSILKNGKFTDFQLRNLRLRQLLTLTEITQSVEKLRDELPTPLQTAQLAFVYGQPISISFRQDEKRFDVIGAYNLRYEIIKKRIDKASVTLPDGTRERLTQPGKIAIVYATDQDRKEYMGYIDFLRRKNLVEGDTEDLMLNQLQGVQGLKALRIKIAGTNASHRTELEV
ncbi:MAG: hypothetical protein Kow0027_02340 [Saprospiraceae bacterium]